MILKELRLSHFGKFEDKEVSLKPGINIVYGKNEAGKSTIHSFIRGMLFGIERQRGRASKDDLYIKYLPWKNQGTYDGSMDIIAGNHEYRLFRNFTKEHKSFRIVDLATGREVPLEHRDISDLIPGLCESVYRNTVSIEQLHTGTDDELSQEVRNYIANLSVSRTNEVDVRRALASLTQKRKEIQSKLNLLDTKNLSDKIEKKLDELSKVDELNEQLFAYELEERTLRVKREEILKDDDKMKDLHGNEQFEQMKAKFYEYQNLKERCTEMNKSYQQLTKSMNDLLRVENSHKTIYTDIEAINQIHEEKHQLENEMRELQAQERELLQHHKKRSRLLNLLPVLIFMVLSLVIFRFHTIGISLCVGAAFAGIVLYLYKQYRFEEQLKKLEQQELEIDRCCIEYEAKKRDIFLQNNVTGDAELRYKVQMIRHNEEELFECKDERKEVETEQVRLYSLLEHLLKEISRYASRYFKDASVDEALFQDIEYEVNLRKETVEKELIKIDQAYEQVVVKLERTKWELSRYEEFEEELQRDQKLFDDCYENKCKLEKDLQATLLAIESIHALSIDIHDSFGDQINEHLSDIVRRVTNGKYSSVKMDENLKIKVLYGHEFIPFEKLSAGAIAEIYLALRITIADILNGTKCLPLILDDAFVLYDDERLQSTLRELDNSTDRQVIVFTCHTREKEMLDQMGLSYHYVDLSENLVFS